ncbi:MAG TPA: BON domain-containing protein [Actinomycetota bacterium]|jgi:gas vesicle protein|nr:BON domain-containing protein [Actinomycetota bacterium]
MRVKRLVLPLAGGLAWSRLLSADQREKVRDSIREAMPERIGPLVVTERRSARKKTMAILGLGAAIGAVLSYFFDPDRGRGRRAKFRDMTTSRARRAADDARKMRLRAENKAQGIQAELTPRRMETVPNDPTLAQKIQSEVLRDFPKGKINVNVEEGYVVLRGELEQPDQIKALEAAVANVPGVVGVENLTHLPGTPAPGRS